MLSGQATALTSLLGSSMPWRSGLDCKGMVKLGPERPPRRTRLYSTNASETDVGVPLPAEVHNTRSLEEAEVRFQRYGATCCHSSVL